MTRRQRCTWCGELDHGLRLHMDAADKRHWFYKACWAEHCNWLCGLDQLAKERK